MFKERLIFTIKYVWNELILPAIAFLLGVIVLACIAIFLPKLTVIALWIIAIVVALSLIIALSSFVHWLFIEPFRKKNELE